ncbi:ferredoxin-thioredoxin reductase catalytic domain-containing protein [Desulfosediminicola flagellatus]|uniref:ferredoxin-thioredoxin reductase catalytic domain-containing protein n=1 Tax=Desulfosediminicola flagellatus TaxID=2569541 RepID=UPI0010AB96AA|nr:ferredoxin-thioredoxin reductase catalytic domain-containing protein [Desulfosediminicola flagellatus]
MTSQNIILYSLTTCGFCSNIKKMLDDLKVSFTLIQADELDGDEKKQVMKALRKVNPKCSFPTVVVGDEVVIGYKVQEIKEKIGIRTEVDELYDMLKKVNEPKGYYLNGNREKTFELLRGLITNKKRYGYMACPCRLGSGERDNDRDIICPCTYREPDVKEFGSCYCSLYVSADWYTGKIDRVEVPERRPPELYDFD